MKEVWIQENDGGQRLDKFLQKGFPKLTKSMMYKAIRNKKIKVNRKRCTFDQKLQSGDQILLFLPPDVLETRQKTIQEAAPIEVVYEDPDILVVNKPAGLLSQKDSPQDQDTLNDRILAYLVRTGAYDPSQELSFTPAICHRLDRNTKGLVVAAKNAAAARMINEGIREHKLKKEYRALVMGTPQEGWVDLYMKKEGMRALVSREPLEDYKPARMHVQLLSSNGQQSLIQVELETGRFHQIRAGLAFLGHPLVGDRKYGYSGLKNRYELEAFRLDLKDLNLPGHPGIIELPSRS